MEKNKSLKNLVRSFQDNKMSYTIFLFSISAALGIFGNKFGLIYYIVGFLPIALWSILLFEDRKTNRL